MKFTKEEISLCKQVLGGHKKEIEFGDWYYETDLEDIFLCEEINGQYVFPNLIPLWTISDCLEFLKEKFHILALRADDKFECELYLKTHSCSEVGKTPLEACLKAVLAVLEEKK